MGGRRGASAGDAVEVGGADARHRRGPERGARGDQDARRAGVRLERYRHEGGGDEDDNGPGGEERRSQRKRGRGHKSRDGDSNGHADGEVEGQAEKQQQQQHQQQGAQRRQRWQQRRHVYELEHRDAAGPAAADVEGVRRWSAGRADARVQRGGGGAPAGVVRVRVRLGMQAGGIAVPVERRHARVGRDQVAGAQGLQANIAGFLREDVDAQVVGGVSS